MVLALTVLFLPQAEAKKYKFPISTVIPATVSTLDTSKDKNGNQSIVFKAKNLAAPDRLQPARNIYVLWAETSEAGVINLGAVKVANSLKASLSTVTPFTPVRIFLTAEDSQKPMVPNGQVVLNTAL